MKNSQNFYLALIHHPITNKRGEKVTTSVTNLDIHDIARSCETFGIRTYFIVTPLKAQHELVGKILGHWDSDSGNLYNPDRSEALRQVELKNSLSDVVEKVSSIEGKVPLLAMTGANFQTYDGNCKDLIKISEDKSSAVLLCFGTGWGLHCDALEKADFKLNPIISEKTLYNHLSVRSAVAIYLDRLFGKQ